MKAKRLLLFSLSSALLSVVLTGLGVRGLEADWLGTAALLEAEYRQQPVVLDEAPRPQALMARSLRRGVK